MRTVTDPTNKVGPLPIFFLLFAILCLGAWLRLYDLGGSELQWDEHLAMHRAYMPIPQLLDSLNGQSASDVSQDTSPPLHHLFIHFASLLGEDDFWVRLPSVFFGLASLFMLFLVGRQFFSERAGLCSALYGALLQFHIAYSRYMRWYVFFYTFALLSLYFYRKLLDDRRVPTVLWYGLSTVLMLYSSYIAAPFVLAQILFTAGLCLFTLHDPTARRGAWRLPLAHGLGLLVAGLLYLPQVKGHLVAYYTFYRTGGNAFDMYRVAKAFREMTLYFRDTDFAGTGIVLLFMALGLTRRWTGRTRDCLLLLLVWCAVPTLVAFTINVQTQITAKYLIGLYFAILLLTGAGADNLAGLVAGRLLTAGSRRSNAVTMGLGLTAVIVIAWPNFEYAALYRSWQHNHSAWARYLLQNKQDVDFVMFEYNRPKKVVLRRELKEAYRYFDTVADHAYKKFYYVTQKGGHEMPGLVLAKEMPQSDETIVFYRGGVASQAPVVVHPDRQGLFSLTDNFTTLKFYETVWDATNVAPDYNLHALSVYSLDNPGQATWKLAPAPGVRCREITLRAEAALRSKIRRMRPDARVRLFAGHDPSRLELVEEIDFERFGEANPGILQPDATGSASLSLRKTLPWPEPESPLYVRVAFVPGQYAAYIDLERLGFDVACDQTGPAVDPALAVLDNIAANTQLTPWMPDQDSLGRVGLHVFAADDARHPPGIGNIPWQSAVMLARFQAVHPNLPPVSVIADQDGSPAFYVYDTRLAQSTMTLPCGREAQAVLDASLPWTVRGLSYAGVTSRPVVHLGGKTLSIPLAVPAGSLVQITPGGEGLVSLNPLFTPDGFNLYNMIQRDNLNVMRNTLSCLEDRPCTAQWVFASELPIKGVRAMIFPALKTDKPQYARVFYGINDMAARNTLVEFSERGPLDISSTYEGVVGQVNFDKKPNILFVGCELSGQGASLQSDEKYTMRIEVLLDAASLPPVTVDHATTTIGQESETCEPMTIWLTDNPLPIRQIWNTR